MVPYPHLGVSYKLNNWTSMQNFIQLEYMSSNAKIFSISNAILLLFCQYIFMEKLSNSHFRDVIFHCKSKSIAYSRFGKLQINCFISFARVYMNCVVCVPSLSTNLFALFFHFRAYALYTQTGKWMPLADVNSETELIRITIITIITMANEWKWMAFECWNSWKHCFIYINMAPCKFSDASFHS